MISLLIYILLLLLIFGVVLNLLPTMPANFKMMARLIVALILILILVNAILGIPPLHHPWLN